jgi:hypothetical protein
MRLPLGIAVAVAALALVGCPNPNSIGVQDTGTVAVTTVDGSTGQPVAGVLVNAGSTITCTTGPNGTCSMQVPVGKWTLIASVPGLHGSADVTIVKDTQATVTIQMSQ